MTTGNGNLFSVLVRSGELNRGGARGDRHTLTPIPLDIVSADLSYAHNFSRHRIEFGLGYQDLEDPATGTSDDEIRTFIQWRWNP